MSQLIEQALVAQLNAIPELTALLGTIPGSSSSAAIFKSGVPQTYDYGADGPALTYRFPEKANGHVLTGSDGIVDGQAEMAALSYSYGTSKRMIEAIFNGIDGPPGTWGDGTCQIISVVQQDDADQPIPPKAGTDQWIYQVTYTYAIKYRVSIPTLT